MALHDALTQVLELQLPRATEERSLTDQFRLVELEHPELPQVQASIELIDRLRTKYITAGVPSWPVPLSKLPGMVTDCLRVIQRLEAEVGDVTEVINGTVGISTIH